MMVDASLLIIANTRMSSLDAIMNYEGAQNDSLKKLYA